MASSLHWHGKVWNIGGKKNLSKLRLRESKSGGAKKSGKKVKVEGKAEEW